MSDRLARKAAIADRLLAIRTSSGMSQRKIAAATGVSAAYVWQCETNSGPSLPSPDYLVAFAEVTATDSDELCLLAGLVPPDVGAAITTPEGLRQARAALKLDGV